MAESHHHRSSAPSPDGLTHRDADGHARMVDVSEKAITDREADALSAHYTYYDPDYARLSLGTFAILKQIELVRERGMHHLYLGLYIGENEFMRYKARFRPHERLIDGIWTPFP